MSAKNKKSKNIPMSNQAHKDPEIVFSRKFRWVLSGRYLVEHFVKNVSIDHYAKTITIEYYDVLTGKSDTSLNGLKWASALQEKSLPDEVLYFTTYDGCGSEIYKIEFNDISILEHKCEFDYSNTDASTRIIKVQFKESYIINPLDQSLPKKYSYKFNIVSNGKTQTIDARIKTRPSLNISLSEIPYLNATFSLPGSFKWEPLEVKLLMNESGQLDLLKDYDGLMPTKIEDCSLELYTDEQILERWIFKDTLVFSIVYQIQQIDMKLCLNSVSFESFKV